MSLQVEAPPPSSQHELSELYASYKQLVLALAAGLIFEEGLGAVSDHASLLRARCTAAAAATGSRTTTGQATVAVGLAVDQLLQTLHLVQRRHGDAEAAMEQVRQQHRSLRRQVWRVLPLEYPSCGGGHSHGGPHVHQDAEQHHGSSDT